MKKIAIGICVICVIIICIILYKNNCYNIDMPPSVYLENTIESQTKYVKFIEKYMLPKKLSNFLNVQRIRFSVVEGCETGKESIAWFTYEAYRELFYQMFDKNRKGYDDCPVTESFKNKFGNNLFEYYNFNDIEDSLINCILFDDEQKIEIEEAGDFYIGEPGYIFYHHFHYILDNEGNVDDIIFDYTE